MTEPNEEKIQETDESLVEYAKRRLGSLTNAMNKFAEAKQKLQVDLDKINADMSACQYRMEEMGLIISGKTLLSKDKQDLNKIGG